MSNKRTENATLSNSIFKSNINALISIYYDSEEIRNQKIKQIEADINKWSEENLGKDFSEIIELSNDIFEYQNHYHYHFDYLLMNSLFISAFSLFENHLKRLTQIAEQELESNIKLGDIKGKGDVDTMRKYLFLVHNIKCANSDLHEWNEILEFKAIRNAIVHNGSILNHKRKENPEKLKGYKKLIQHDIWLQPNHIYFRIKKITFLEDFRTVAVNYSNKLTMELIVK